MDNELSLLTYSLGPELEEAARKAKIRNLFKKTKGEAKLKKALSKAAQKPSCSAGEDWEMAYRSDLSPKAKRDCKVPSTDFNGFRRDGLTRPKNPVKITSPKNKIRRIKSRNEK